MDIWPTAASPEAFQALDRSILAEKVRDIVGPYLSPPKNAVVCHRAAKTCPPEKPRHR